MNQMKKPEGSSMPTKLTWLALFSTAVGVAFVPGQPAPTLVDPGHDHVHIIRNEGSVPASTIAVQLVPYDPAKANRGASWDR
jgi:hypothetical protein